jgi:hypothetical protein
VLLRAADELHVDAFLSDATWQTLAKRYDTNQLIDLVYGIGEIMMHADVANTLGIEIEADRTDRLPSAVPYRVAARWTRYRQTLIMRVGVLSRQTPGRRSRQY